jgi:hypothetical protein
MKLRPEHPGGLISRFALLSLFPSKDEEHPDLAAVQAQVTTIARPGADQDQFW